MLDVTVTTIRLFLHVLAASVWVGGQITVAGLVPGARRLSPDAPRAIGRRFAQLAWPAFGVLVVTGIWNVVAVSPTLGTPYATTLFVKIIVVAVAGVAALLHGRSRTPRSLAVWGAIGGLASVAALFLGVLLNG